jgi:hypothetical protein
MIEGSGSSMTVTDLIDLGSMLERLGSQVVVRADVHLTSLPRVLKPLCAGHQRGPERSHGLPGLDDQRGIARGGYSQVLPQQEPPPWLKCSRTWQESIVENDDYMLFMQRDGMLVGHESKEPHLELMRS